MNNIALKIDYAITDFDDGIEAQGRWIDDFGNNIQTTIFACGCTRDTNVDTGEQWWTWCDRSKLVKQECIRRKKIKETCSFMDIGWSPRSEGFVW